MCCDTTLLLRHKNESLSQFWISLENEYPFLSLNAIKMLVIFSRTYARISFSISSKPDREIVWMPTQNIVFLKLHCSHIYLAHLQGYSRKCNTKFNKLL